MSVEPPNKKKIEIHTLNFFFGNFVGKEENKCLILTYYRVSYNSGLY